MPQTEKISVFRQDQDSVLEKLKVGPILLMQRSNPKCVLVDLAQWNTMATELQTVKRKLAKLEGYLEAKQSHARMKADPSSTTTLTELCEKFNVVEKPAVT